MSNTTGRIACLVIIGSWGVIASLVWFSAPTRHPQATGPMIVHREALPDLKVCSIQKGMDALANHDGVLWLPSGIIDDNYEQRCHERNSDAE